MNKLILRRRVSSDAKNVRASKTMTISSGSKIPTSHSMLNIPTFDFPHLLTFLSVPVKFPGIRVLLEEQKLSSVCSFIRPTWSTEFHSQFVTWHNFRMLKEIDTKVLEELLILKLPLDSSEELSFKSKVEEIFNRKYKIFPTMMTIA